MNDKAQIRARLRRHPNLRAALRHYYLRKSALIKDGNLVAHMNEDGILTLEEYTNARDAYRAMAWHLRADPTPEAVSFG